MKASLGVLAAAAALIVGSSGGVVAQTAGAQTPGVPAAGAGPISGVTFPAPGRQPLSDLDQANLKAGLAAARRGDAAGARSARESLGDPAARKIVQWAAVDAAGESLSFFELDQAVRDLEGWPRETRRRQLAERRLETSGLAPAATIAWFAGREPATAEGAMALASAYRASGKPAEAAVLIRRWWRDQLFDADAQRSMLARFGDALTVDDHIRRADVLLLGPQGPAARDMLTLLPAEQRQVAEARIALRGDSAGAPALVSALPPLVRNDPGLAFEQAAFYRRKNLDVLALQQVSRFPPAPPHTDGQDRMWRERRLLVNAALRNGDSNGAYHAAANAGFAPGVNAAEAEFYAGWIALSRLKNPALAETHFARLQAAGGSPITLGRAGYWRGRAAEARGDRAAAQGFYQAGAQYPTTFYGQLAAEKAGVRTLTLGVDPQPTPADRARFEGRDAVRAMRMLMEAGERPLFQVFALSLDDQLPNREECALLVDAARGYGDQDTSMKVVRACAQRGFIMPDRGYPLRRPQLAAESPEQALVLGVTRQESGFDPRARSAANARGMMQLLPATAALTARRIGVGYSAGQLEDPDYNMLLGSAFFGHMVSDFGGSYVLAAAAYNAGPGRPATWVGFCGDPRAGGADPLDFIECIPFSETRNYVMRVLEGMQVYRARLNGGSVPLTLSQDLRRGAYGFQPPAGELTQSAAGDGASAAGGEPTGGR